jgi:hypothetical protein
MSQPPTAEQSADAKRNGMWFLCVPPRPDVLEKDGIGSEADRVAAWLLHDVAIENDPFYARRWAELIRARDIVSGRPIMLEPQGDWTAAGLTANVLLAGRVRMSVLERVDYEKWLSANSKSSRPGTAIWAYFPTQFDPVVGKQVAALTGISSPPPNVGFEQIEVLSRASCMNGVRGFVFGSHAPLNGTDVETRRRALALELTNWRLQLIEPWLAGGSVIGRIESTDAAWGGVILNVDRARLIMPMQIVAKKTGAPQDTSFIVPGISESSQVFTLTPASLKALTTQRVAGGVRFSLEPRESTYILITENPLVIRSLRQRITRDGPRNVQVLRESVVAEAALLADSARRLSALGVNMADTGAALASVDPQVRQVDALMATGSIGQAEQAVIAARDAIRKAAEARDREIQSPVLVSNPLAVGSERLPDFVTFERSSMAMVRGDNLVYGGDFEDLGQMTHIGWKHMRSEVAGVDSRAEISTVEPRHGSSCLLLQNAATSDTAPPEVADAPVWIQSPPIPITDAGWIEITGWVRVDQPITGSPD